MQPAYFSLNTSMFYGMIFGRTYLNGQLIPNVMLKYAITKE